MRHRAYVRAVLAELTRDPSEIDDLEQETWRTAIERPPRKIDRLRFWMARVARNLALNVH
jgi:DNA-directed RNA polymerase specialized sigma24 family protein